VKKYIICIKKLLDAQISNDINALMPNWRVRGFGLYKYTLTRNPFCIEYQMLQRTFSIIKNIRL